MNFGVVLPVPRFWPFTVHLVRDGGPPWRADRAVTDVLEVFVRAPRRLPQLTGWLRVTVAATVVTTATLTLSASPAQAGSYSAPLRTAISDLPISTEVRTGYDRTLFPHWKDLDGDCQNTRQEVLIAESNTSPTFTTSTGCTVATGSWLSYYDRVTWTAPSDVDIDHMVPLAESWDSGARNWTTARRQSFANDLGDDRSLVAVTDNVNQSKGDQDPATWLPTYDRCRYLAEWTAVKIRWGLSVDSAEKNALTSLGLECTNVTLSVTTV